MYIAASEYFTSEQSGYIASVWFIERMCFKLYNSFFDSTPQAIFALLQQPIKKAQSN
jgi:hypothetical protein